MNKIPNILKEIIENKKREIIERKKVVSLESIKEKLKKSDRDFLKAIRTNKVNKINLIAEIKKSSPSMNVSLDLKVEEIAKLYEKNNVSAISVLCDNKYFSGSLNDLSIARNSTFFTPVLCKEFVIDEYQIYEARKFGADAILLIIAILSKEEIRVFLNIADKLNMDVVCEVNNEKEINKILELNPKIVMINNRNLNTFKVDLDTTNNLIRLIPKDKVIISASGLNSSSDVLALSNKVNAILVGTSIVKSDNINEKIKELLCQK